MEYVSHLRHTPRAAQRPPNCPHKLTKTAEPWLGGGAAFGRLRTARPRHVGCCSPPPLRVSRGSRRAASGGRHGRRFLQLRVITLCGCANLAVLFCQILCDCCSSPQPCVEPTCVIRSRRTRRTSHWQSVRTFSAFGTRSAGVGSITWPAQWHTGSPQPLLFARKDVTDHHSLHLPRSRRRRDAAPAAPSPDQANCSQHGRRGSCRNRAPERENFRLRHGKARGTQRRGGNALVNRREERAPHNDPHKLTKAAEPWLGGGAAVGGSNCTPASRRLPGRSCPLVLVAAAAVPLLTAGTEGGLCSLE